MSHFYIFITVLVFSDFLKSSAHEENGFTYIGRSLSSSYLLSNDKRNVDDSRVGCAQALPDGVLVALETPEEHQGVKRLLSIWGITEDDRVWTTGIHDGDMWVWYDYNKAMLTPIENACDGQEWLNNVCPTNGCLAIGGQGATYKWQNDTCNAKRRYLCEQPDTDSKSFKPIV